MSLPPTGRALVFDPATGDFGVREMPLRPLRDGEILVRVRLSTICGSDLHTIRGRRDPGGQIVLGHEICGTVAALGDGVREDSLGRELREGDRLTWGIAASCGRCFFCARGIPQKCVRLFKYGHETLEAETPLSGGFAEYCYLVPGTPVHRLPAEVPDELAVFANCALATMAAVVRRAEVTPGGSALIQGAGLVGLCAAAVCGDRGAETVAVMDPCEERLALAGLFGATHTLNPAEPDGDAVTELQSVTPQGRGFDLAIEACGAPQVVPQGIEALRVGGTYMLAGCVYPGCEAGIDLQRVTTKMLRLLGQHNYAPVDLEEALSLLRRAGKRFAFDRVVAATYALEEIDGALAHLERDRSALRVALRP
ncbi:MAG: zinc-binding dehydrogenase [Armatimonadota bacterium]